LTKRVIVSQSEFARLRGVSRQTVTAVWKKQGRLVLTADGKVDVKATEKPLALRPETYRGGTVKAKPGKAGKKPARTAEESPVSADEAVPILDRSPAEIAESSNWTLVEAQRVKEIYLALLRKQEFEVERGELVEIEAVAHEVEREYSIVRERLLTFRARSRPLSSAATAR
jgi:hypothetical protein